MTHLSAACDVVFGATCVLLAVLGTWQWYIGEASSHLALALWALPAVNLAWSAITKHRERVRADLLRGFGSFPLTIYIYVAEEHGLLGHLWIPALMSTLGACLSVGIGSRNPLRGTIISLSYTIGILAVGRFTVSASHDAIALLVANTIVSIVAVHLGRTLVESAHRRDEAGEQRTRAELALAELHREMERRKQMQAELVQAQKLESVGRLAAGIAHEINTPVQFVGDSLQFVRYAVEDLMSVARSAPPQAEIDLDYLTDELPGALGRASDGLERVTRIVRSMKVFAHPDAVAMAPANLNAAIEATLIVAHNEYKYVADLVTDLASDLPPVSCFISELNQAVLNIVINAAHAIGEVVAGTTARGTIAIATRCDGEDVLISIRDTGTGVPEAIRGRVFDPFFTTKEVGKGTGQGLSIAHAIVVEKHRGKLWFDTELGHGTSFFIRISLAGAQGPAARDHRAFPPSSVEPAASIL